MNQEEKAKYISELAAELSDSNVLYLADTGELTVEVVNQLRRRCFNSKIRMRENDVAIKYFLTNDTKQLKGMEILSPSDTASIYIDYLSRQNVGGMNVPQEVVIKVITARNNLLITLSYDRVEVNEPQPLYFIVPEGYEDCE